MKQLKYAVVVAGLFISSPLSAQSPQVDTQLVVVQGMVYESISRGYLRNADIKVINELNQKVIAEAISDAQGSYELKLPPNVAAHMIVEKKHFLSWDSTFSTADLSMEEVNYLKVPLDRKPGYVLDVTIAEANDGSGSADIDAIVGSRIEVFNNTTSREELILENYPHPNFKFKFEKGNHYTIMIRKKGYINKRIEAYIDIEGCILCFDGLGIIEPGVTDIMAYGNDIGTFLANIELEPAELNKSFAIDNIYYDFNKWDIRHDAAEELDKLLVTLKDNPAIIIEMGSHTDARGRDAYNLSLSDKRAKSAAEYLISQGIDRQRLTWKGYGETQLFNGCEDGVTCSEESHQENRRTELKIVGFMEEDPLDNKTLKDIILEENAFEHAIGQETYVAPK